MGFGDHAVGPAQLSLSPSNRTCPEHQHTEFLGYTSLPSASRARFPRSLGWLCSFVPTLCLCKTCPGGRWFPCVFPLGHSLPGSMPRPPNPPAPPVPPPAPAEGGPTAPAEPPPTACATATAVSSRQCPACPQHAVARLQGSPKAMSSTDVAVAPEAAGNDSASDYPRGSSLACWRTE